MGPQAEPIARDNPVKVAFASLIGTTIEWYDFFLYGAAAALVFNEQFFPNLSPTAGTLAAFATFGASFVARPVGAVVFGHFGDRLGRKRMMVLSLMLMGGATGAMGLLPNYHEIGVAAPVLLVVARLVQGLAVGGEWGGAALMAVEHAPPGRRAFFGSWPQVGVPAGLVLSSVAFLAVEQLPGEQATNWGWRLPFLASLVLVLVGVYVRLRIMESPDFRKVQESGSVLRFPLADVLRLGWRQTLVGAFAQAAVNIPFYIATVFVLSYGPSVGVSRDLLLTGIIVASLVEIVTMPVAAIIADRIGPRTVLLAGAVGMGVVAFPFFWLIDQGSVGAVLGGMILLLSIAHPLTYAAIARFMAELFDARFRYTGASFSYHFGGLVTSGPAPYAAAALFAAFASTHAVSTYIIVAAAVTIAALLFAPKVINASLASSTTRPPGDASPQSPGNAGEGHAPPVRSAEDGEV